MSFSFDRIKHKYECDGLEMPSVSSILKDAGHGGFYCGTAKRDRGTAIHEATEIYDAIGVRPMDDGIINFVEAWARYREDTDIEIIESERQVYNLPMWYAGTLDRIVKLRDGTMAILDIKSGAKAAWHGLQLAAYALAEEWVYEINTGIVVYLKETGKYSTEPYTGIRFEAQKREWIQIMKGRTR